MSDAWIPDGNLPKWLLFVSVLALFNCGQNYVDHNFSRKVYTQGNAQVTPLSARTFGVWNLASAMIRIYCAYNIHVRPVYHMCMWSYVIALGHFASEVAVFKTARLTPGIISPLVVASTSLIVMFFQHDTYVP